MTQFGAVLYIGRGRAGYVASVGSPLRKVLRNVCGEALLALRRH